MGCGGSPFLRSGFAGGIAARGGSGKVIITELRRMTNRVFSTP
jgi:hypothetical protein